MVAMARARRPGGRSLCGDRDDVVELGEARRESGLCARTGRAWCASWGMATTAVDEWLIRRSAGCGGSRRGRGVWLHPGEVVVLRITWAVDPSRARCKTHDVGGAEGDLPGSADARQVTVCFAVVWPETSLRPPTKRLDSSLFLRGRGTRRLHPVSLDQHVERRRRRRVRRSTTPSVLGHSRLLRNSDGSEPVKRSSSTEVGSASTISLSGGERQRHRGKPRAGRLGEDAGGARRRRSPRGSPSARRRRRADGVVAAATRPPQAAQDRGADPASHHRSAGP